MAEEFPEGGGAIKTRVMRRDRQKPRGFRIDNKTITTAELVAFQDEISELIDFADQHFIAVLSAVFRERRENEGGSLAD